MPLPDLLEVFLPLWPRSDQTVALWHGLHAHGLVFHLLTDAARSDDATLGRRLHDANERPRFTASEPLDPRTGRALTHPEPGQPLWLRLTFHSQATVALWERIWARWASQPAAPVLHLGPDDRRHPHSPACAVRDFTIGADLPPGRAASFDDLVAGLGARPPGRWRVQFLTPTTFALGNAPGDRASPRLSLPLPDPRLLLESLGNAWRQLAPTDALRQHADVPRVAELARHLQLQAGQVNIARDEVHMEQPGGRPARVLVRLTFTGEVVLEHRPDRGAPPGGPAALEQRRRLGMLLRLGEIVGAGSQTARGLGRLRADPDAVYGPGRSTS